MYNMFNFSSIQVLSFEFFKFRILVSVVVGSFRELDTFPGISDGINPESLISCGVLIVFQIFLST